MQTARLACCNCVSTARLSGTDLGVELRDSEQFREVDRFYQKASEVFEAFQRAGRWRGWSSWPKFESRFGLPAEDQVLRRLGVAT